MLFAFAVISPRKCLRVQEIPGYLRLKTCLPLHLAHLSPWHHSYRKQKSVNAPLVVGADGTKSDLLLMQKIL